MVSINAGPSHQHTPFTVDDGAISGRVIVKVDRQPVVRVFIVSYTRCPPLIWISTHAQLPRVFGAFPPSSLLQSTPSRKHTTIPRSTNPMGTGCSPSDRECASPPSGSNNNPFCYNVHIAFFSGHSSISCHIRFPHINGFHLSTFVSQQSHLMYVCQPALTDLLTPIRTSCRSL